MLEQHHGGDGGRVPYRGFLGNRACMCIARLVQSDVPASAGRGTQVFTGA